MGPEPARKAVHADGPGRPVLLNADEPATHAAPKPTEPSRPTKRREHSALRLSVGRHPTDLGRLAIAAAVLVLCSLLAVLPGVNPVEASIFREIEQLPGALSGASYGIDFVGGWAGILACAALAAYLRRLMLALKLLLAGTAAWGAAHFMQLVLGHRGVPLGLAHTAQRLPGASGFPFPSDHVAIIAALVTTASPFLPRRLGRLTWALVVLVAAADVYRGIHLPLDVFAGAVLGWGIGTLSHLAWGAPGRRASPEAALRALRQAGREPAQLVPIKGRPMGPLEYEVSTTDGDVLRMQIVRRLHRRAGPWYTIRRAVAALDVENEPRLSTPRHEAEHEAYVTLLAERAGVRTPPVLLAGVIQHGPPFLLRRQIEGHRISHLPKSRLTDALLEDVWRQVRTLHEQRIAHHDLRIENILVDPEGAPWILDFTFGTVGATAESTAQDLAEALVSITALVGVERTVCTAARAFPREALQAAMAYLQPLALPARVRSQLGDERYELVALREALAEQIGCPVPTYRTRIRPTTIAVLVVGAGAVYLLLPQLASMPRVLHSLRHANIAWLAASFLTGIIAIPVSALSIMGSARMSLPFWKTTAVQVAAAFTGRTTPGGVGFFGVNIVFLERLGMRRSHAVGVTLLNRAAMGIVSGIATIAGVLAIGTSRALKNVTVPTGWPVVVAAAGVLVLAGVIIGSPFGRRRVVRPSMEMIKEMGPTLRNPVRAAELFGGSLGFLALSAVGLAASLAAFQPHFPLVAVLAVYVVGSTLGQLAPTPGGLGAVEAALVAGLTALGVLSTAAVAAVLVFRLLTFWLPILPGLAMFRYLQHRGIV